MTSIAVSAQGAVISIKNLTASPQVYIPIGGITSFNGFDGARSEKDVSDFLSTAKEKRLGLRDNGSLTLQGFRHDADPGQAKISLELSNPVSSPWRIALNNGKKYDFAAFVKSYTISGSVDDPVGTTITLTIDGAVTYS